MHRQGHISSIYPKYWPLLQSWAQYLVTVLPDPGDQLCTDDFEGVSEREGRGREGKRKWEEKCEAAWRGEHRRGELIESTTSQPYNSVCNIAYCFFCYWFFVFVYIQPSPHNVNLAAKGIVALGAFGTLCEKLGKHSDVSAVLTCRVMATRSSVSYLVITLQSGGHTSIHVAIFVCLSSWVLACCLSRTCHVCIVQLDSYSHIFYVCFLLPFVFLG